VEIRRRYATWGEAAAGHEYICQLLAETGDLEDQGLVAFICAGGEL
jgi:hypothetical protein